MWICEKCNEENEDSFDACWKCFKGSELEKQQIEEYNTSEEEEKRAKSARFYSKLGRAFLSLFISLLIFIFLFKTPVYGNYFLFIILSIVCYYIIKSVFKKK